MKRQHCPQMNTRYWAAILLASIFGTNMGDLYVAETRLKLLQGIALLIGFAAVVFVAEFDDKRHHELFYWLVVVIIRTGAPNIADYLAYETTIPDWFLIFVFAAITAIFAAVNLRHADGEETQWHALPNTDTWYWLAMLGAGVFGTIAGDWFEHWIGLGPAAILLLVVFLACFLSGTKLIPGLGARKWRALLAYWLTIVAARLAGTALGDWLAGSNFLRLGLRAATVVSGLAFVLVLFIWKGTSRARYWGNAGSPG